MSTRTFIISIAFIFGVVGHVGDLLSQSLPSCTVSNVDPHHDTLVNAIKAANDGDVICLASTIGQGGSGGTPLNYVEWDSGINVTTGPGGVGTIAVEIRGAGNFNTTCLQYDNITPAASLIGGCGANGQTNIYLHNATAGNGLGWFTTSSTKNITISNITFLRDGNTPVPGMESGFILAGSAGLGKIAPFIIHHNDFISNCTVFNGFMLLVNSNQGVMYRNRFMNNGTQTGGGGNLICNGPQAWNHTDGGNGNTTWSSNSTFGSADDGTNNLYVENNYFRNFAAFNDLHDGGAREVVRFNEFHNSGSASHGWDSTGAGGGRGIEFYDNDFFCDEFSVINATYITQRTGTGFYHSNTFHSYPASKCAPNMGNTPILLNQPGTESCNIGGAFGWPGQGRSSDATHNSYPMPHQDGWGFNSTTSPTNVKIGTSPSYSGSQSSPQINRTDQPGSAAPLWAFPIGTDGVQQSLEPMYMMNNTNLGNIPVTAVKSGANDCRAEANSAQSKANSQTLTIPDTANGAPAVTYANSGQQAVMVFADLIGSGTIMPTIQVNGSNSCGTITPLNTGVSGSLRLSAWTCTINTDGPQTVVFTSSAAASTAARAGTVLFLRGLKQSSLPFNTNPVVASTTTNPYTATAASGYTDNNNIIIGYFALPVPSTDNLQPGSNDALPSQCNAQCLLNGVGSTTGTNGTTGGSDVSVATTYRVVNQMSAASPNAQESDSTGCGGCAVLAGSVSFTVNGSTANAATVKTVLDMDSADFIKADNEYYDDLGPNSGQATFNGLHGTGAGTTAQMNAILTCTQGVGFWVTDQGSWNTSGSGGQGQLYKCGASNNWVSFYIPYIYPHPLDTVGGGGNSQSFSQQPTNTIVGHAISPNVQITLTSTTVDSMTLTPTSGTCNVTGSTTISSTGGTPNTATWSLTASVAGSNCIFTSHDNTDNTVPNILSNSFNFTSSNPATGFKGTLGGHK